MISAAGRHGTSAIWKGDDGSDLFRESILLRGMVTELDEAIHIGPNGQPDRIVIRGTTPSGDAQENFSVNDREARWKSPVDSGAAAYDNRAYYVPYGGTMSSIAVLAEKLLTAPGRKLPLLPKGEARLERLVSISIGEGSAQQTLTAYSIDGLSLSPIPVWLDAHAKFFAAVNPGASLSVVPEGYAGTLQRLQSSQDQAMLSRAGALARRFGALPKTPVAFTHVRLFDSEQGRFLDDQTVITEKDRITARMPAGSLKTPAGAKVIEGAGKTLLPGLWDSHMHVGDDFTGAMLLSLGVTSIRDPGSPLEQIVSRAARIKKGELLFPAVYPSLLIDGKGPLAAQGAYVVESADQAVAAVRIAKEKGLTGVKFYGSMKKDWLLPAVAEARRLGLHVHGHIPAGMRPSEAISAGYEEITHINMLTMQAMPDDIVRDSNGIFRFQGPGRYAKDLDLNAAPMRPLIQEMANKHISSDPTLVAFESTYVPENGDLSEAYRPFLGTLPPATERSFLAGGFLVPPGVTRADYRASFQKMIALAGELQRAGVMIVAGTDGYGLEIVRELELYVEAGMTPAQALQTATINPARLVKADASTGSIAVGKIADMVLVDGDPSRRIGDARRSLWVISAGRLLNADELRTAVGFAGPPH